jgi:putative Mg2+ transporter-C (MgtC) family protein
MHMNWTNEHNMMLINLTCALVAGGLIGLERSNHGRPAGFRTHALVCLTSCLLMFLTIFQAVWLPVQALGMPADSLRTDPTRMAQGIMTGIGFLGAGVIYKDGFNVRGLTTAASIWVTAAIGVLFGVGFYFPAVVVTLLTLLVLSVFRWLESKLDAETHADLNVDIPSDNAEAEGQLKGLLTEQGYGISQVGYRFDRRLSVTHLSLGIKSSRKQSNAELVQALLASPMVLHFELKPSQG